MRRGVTPLAAALVVWAACPANASASTPVEPSCAGNASPGISLDVPRSTAVGPLQAGIYADQNDLGDDNGEVRGTMTVYIYNGSQLAQTENVPANQDPTSDTSEQLIGTYVPSPLGAQLRIVVTYETSYTTTDFTTDPPTDIKVPCDQTLTKATYVFAGDRPLVSMRNNKADRSVGLGPTVDMILNPADHDCAAQIGGYTQRRNVYLTETWRLGRRRWQMYLTPCYKRAPFRTPPAILTSDITGISDAVDSGGFDVGLLPSSLGHNYHFTYGFSIKFQNRTLYSGRMTVADTLAYRIYQGTDAFVNYCIDGNHKVYSSHLVLYCNHPEVSYVHVSGY